MNINSTTPQNYTLKIKDKSVIVPDANRATAAEIDKDKDFFLSPQEIADYVNQGNGGNTSPTALRDQANEFQCSLAQVKNPNAEGYRDFNSVIKEFDKLVKDNPKYVQGVVLGRTPEGRNIMAYKFSEGAQGDTSDKPGVVITGCHHAREWMTVEAPLALGKSLLEGIADDPAKQSRLASSEIWIVPCANPDGYEYSRETDNMWRKNRRPVGQDQLGNPTTAVGIDLNRNYGDDLFNHHIIFRPDGDTPGNTADDFGATSDDPFSEVYRGPYAASEPEVQAMQNLQMHQNIRGVLDMHSYGQDLLYPWSHTPVKPAEDDWYKKVGGAVADAGGYKLEPGIGLYPNSGSSDIFQEANGLRTFTIEMGESFQPDPSTIPETTAKATAASTVFIDAIIAGAQDGSLGERHSIEMPVAQASKQLTRTGEVELHAPSVRTDSSPTERYFSPH